ncbi:MAG: mannonate dehydratase [Clostridiaceae bacterium]|nr:mannonate dehydratase [Clostridiaceae bacterium]
MKNPNMPAGHIKLSNIIAPDADENRVAFLEKLGIRYAYTWKGGDLVRAYDELARLRELLSRHGITLYNAGDYKIAKSPNIHLGTPERDRDIEAFAEVLRTLARLGVYNTTFTWEPDQVWSSGQTMTRGGAIARYCDERELEKKELTHGRRYEKEELWENFNYFMRRIIPVCEETGVRLALHPNDPPMPEIAGIACLIISRDDYRRAFTIADSYASASYKASGARPSLGMEFCCGCWLEGGERFGDILAGVREFAAEKRIIITHFRNVDQPLPHFVETFIDGGYMDMYRLMRTFYEADYDGTIIYDHSPILLPDGGGWAETAYSVGYMQALMRVASERL